MNCRPNQLAMIVLPKEHAHYGLEAMNGRVVRTVCLLARNDMPIWDVTPKQCVMLSRPGIDRRGQICYAGEPLVADGIPDAYLVPFDDESENCAETAVTGLPEILTLQVKGFVE